MIVRSLLKAHQRERQHITAELAKVKGLMPLLMKRRNGGRWTVDERHQLIEQLRALAHLSPYLIVMALPGSVLLLPLLAWWLDRRRYRRVGAPSAHFAQRGHEPPAIAVPPTPIFTDPDKRT